MAEKKPAEPLAQILKRIESTSHVVNEVATTLSNRIKSFENWLDAMPGKIPAECWEPLDHDGLCFGIRLDRRSSHWRLLCGTCHDQFPDQETDWNPLEDASVERKILAVKMFRKLVESIEATQKVRIAEIKKVNEMFDEFAAEIGISSPKAGA